MGHSKGHITDLISNFFKLYNIILSILRFTSNKYVYGKYFWADSSKTAESSQRKIPKTAIVENQ